MSSPNVVLEVLKLARSLTANDDAPSQAMLAAIDQAIIVTLVTINDAPTTEHDALLAAFRKAEGGV